MVIVIIVLLFFMGLAGRPDHRIYPDPDHRRHLCGHGVLQITLERISLGALIIALGMLVDNAIVVVDGMKVRMEQGMDGLQAAKEVVGQSAIPLLGATAVAVLAFASIGGMTNNTGEYLPVPVLRDLISLSLSWLTAVTINPADRPRRFLKKGPRTRAAERNPTPTPEKYISCIAAH